MVDTTICCFQSCAWASVAECALKWLCAAALCVAAILAVAIFVFWVVTGIYTWIKNKNGPNKFMIEFKFWVYRHAFIILLILLPVSIVLALACGWEVLVPIIGFGYFLNRQYLAETNFLWNCIRSFNRKYTKNRDSFLKLNEGDNLITYLNFCSEEYLLYRQGYVDPIIWKTWCHGMLEKMACGKKCGYKGDNPYCHKCYECNAKIELDKGQGYYGLTWKEIEKGAETNL